MTDFLFAIGAARDDRFDASLAQKSTEAVAVIASVGKQLLDARDQAHTRFGLRAIGCVARRKDQDPRTTELINNRVDLGVLASFGQADRLNFGPPFPPLAQR